MKHIPLWNEDDRRVKSTVTRGGVGGASLDTVEQCPDRDHDPRLPVGVPKPNVEGTGVRTTGGLGRPFLRGGVRGVPPVDYDSGFRENELLRNRQRRK